MLAERRRVAHHLPAVVLPPGLVMMPPRSPGHRSPRLGDAAGRKSAALGGGSSSPSSTGHRTPGMGRPVFDFVRSTTATGGPGGGRPLSLPYAVRSGKQQHQVVDDDLGVVPAPFVVDPVVARLRTAGRASGDASYGVHQGSRADAGSLAAYLVDCGSLAAEQGLRRRSPLPLPLPLPYLPPGERRSSPAASSVAMDGGEDSPSSLARSRASPPSSLLDSLSLTEDQGSLLESPRLTPVSSLLDSASLARLRRRHDGELSLLDSAWNQGAAGLPAIKRGVLWQQRERLWSRWKERYFVLTSDYLHCFKRRAAADGLSQMGHFIFKVRLVDLDAVEWINRRSHSAIALSTRSGPRVLLRAVQGQQGHQGHPEDPEGGLEDWFELLEECTLSSKERRRALYQRGGHHPGHPGHPVHSQQVHHWTGSLQREGSLTPRLEYLLRRRLGEHEQGQHDQHQQHQRQSMLLEEEPSPPSGSPAASASGTHRSAPPRPAPPRPRSPGPPEHAPGRAPAQRQAPGLYHRMNHDVFFMAAEGSISDNLSWSSRADYRHHRHTQV